MTTLKMQLRLTRVEGERQLDQGRDAEHERDAVPGGQGHAAAAHAHELAVHERAVGGAVQQDHAGALRGAPAAVPAQGYYRVCQGPPTNFR